MKFVEILNVILKRSVALIILRVSGTLAAGSLLGAELYVAAGMAAFVGLVEVAENLARAYITDGKLDMTEINKVFSGAADEDVSDAQINRAMEMAGYDDRDDELMDAIDEPDEDEVAAELEESSKN